MLADQKALNSDSYCLSGAIGIGNDKGRYHSRRTAVGVEDLAFDEEAAIEAAQERSAVPHLRDILKREHDEKLKRGRFNARMEKRILELDEMIARALARD
jgi:hypothetical protein